MTLKVVELPKKAEKPEPTSGPNPEVGLLLKTMTELHAAGELEHLVFIGVSKDFAPVTGRSNVKPSELLYLSHFLMENTMVELKRAGNMPSELDEE